MLPKIIDWCEYRATATHDDGWHILYECRNRIVDDSAKVWHEDLPRRKDAVRKIEAIARRHMRALAKKI